MADQQPIQQDPISALLAEFGTRLNEISERQRLIKDRALLIGENLISLKKENEEQISEIKSKLNEANLEIKSLKQLNKRIIDELNNLARKNELEILKRQFKIFQPLEFARIKEVRKIVQEELKNQKIK